MAWDLKLRPAKDSAAAKEEEWFEAAVGVEVMVDRFVWLAVDEGCLLCTASCRLFASAFSCWRMNCARD
jgi:hypothetical protein